MFFLSPPPTQSTKFKKGESRYTMQCPMQGIYITKLINIFLDVIPMQWSAHNVFPGKNLYYCATPQERTTKILRKHMIQSINEYANAKTRFLRFTPTKADYILAHFKIHSITCLVKGHNNMIYIYILHFSQIII